ncbi:MAG: DinB family protein, partial [Bacteroidota bacterium]
AAPDGGWSIAQNLEHLNRYGAYYLPQIQKGLGRQQHFSGNEAFKSSWLGNYFTRIMDPQTGRKKYKAFKGYIPGADLDAHGVVAEFIRQQENLLICLQRARRADLNSVRIPVSILKWLRLKLGDVFRFIIAHDERHLVQAGKVAAAVTGR